MFRRDELVNMMVARRSSDKAVISVMSGKGGVGKSVISFNLAERMAHSGLQVLLIDADATGGNIHILANCNTDHGIEELASGQIELAAAVIHASPGLDIVPSSGYRPESAVHTIEGVARLSEIIRSERSKYDVVILDHSSGISKTATALAYASDMAVIVLVPEITSISDAYGLFKYMNEIGGGVNCRLLINRMADTGEAGYIHRKFSSMTERFIGRTPELIGAICEDPEIRRSIGSQASLASIAPDSVALEELTNIAQGLVDFRISARGSYSTTINGTTAAADIKG